MTVPVDPYNFTPNTTADAEQVDARFLPLYTALGGALDVDNFLAAVKDKLGLSDAGVVRRGKSIIATDETRSNAAYGLLTTPDRVSGIVLPTDGLIFVAYQATWKEANPGAARAAIFLGSNQVKRADNTAAAPLTVQSSGSGPSSGPETNTGGFANVWLPLATHGGGLFGAGNSASVGYGGDVTTGQVVGSYLADSVVSDGMDRSYLGPTIIFAAAGTYDVSVQFKASAGAVNAKGRKLWVWTMAF